jgi:hypothetical protein
MPARFFSAEQRALTNIIPPSRLSLTYKTAELIVLANVQELIRGTPLEERLTELCIWRNYRYK